MMICVCGNHCSPNARYAQYCQAVKVLFLEVISVLCFGSGSYEPPQPDLVEGLMELIFNQKEQRTQNLTPFEWEANDDNPVIRSVLLQLILMRELVISYCSILYIIITFVMGCMYLFFL